MVVRIDPVEGPLEGFVPIPYSKSVSARQILIGLHSGGPFTIAGLSQADDTQKLIQIAKACGYTVEQEGEKWTFLPGRLALPPHLAVGEGGTTLRFILPWLAGLPGKTTLYLGGRLSQRPITPLIQALAEASAHIEAVGHTLEITGNPDWSPKRLQIDARQSGQFLSALLLMAPQLEAGSTIRETSGEPATLSYVEGITLTLLRDAEHYWERSAPDEWVLVRGGKGISSWAAPYHARGEADWSGAGYFWGWAMGTAARLELPLSLGSSQPEKTFWGKGPWPVKVEPLPWGLHLISSGECPPAWEGDLSAVPDTFPTLAVLAALSTESWSFTGLRTLPHKESHRLLVMQTELAKIGARIEWSGDVCRVFPPPKLLEERPLSFYAHGDHRVAMALSLLASRLKVPLYIREAEVVAKSFPGYWAALRDVGILLTFEK